MILKPHHVVKVLREIDLRAMKTIRELNDADWDRQKTIKVLEGLLTRLKAAEELENG